MGAQIFCSGISRAQAAEPVRIRRTQVQGCKQIRCRVVKSILLQEKTPWWRRKPKQRGYDPFWAEEDRRRIELFYRGHGFYDAKVAEPEVKSSQGGKGVEILYRIEEGKPILVAGIDIIFADGVEKEKDPKTMRSLLGYKEGVRFELEPYQAAATAMETYYKDHGYFRAQVRRSAEVDPARQSARVSYSITKGAWYRIREVRVEGCQQTKPAVVKRALNLKPGERYSRKRVFENQRRVQRLPIYRTVRLVEEADDPARKVDLVFKVEEGKPREVKVGLGYGSEEGVRVQAGWRHENFLGGARELSVSARWSELLELEEVKLVQPNLGRPGSFLQVKSERKVARERAYTNEAISWSPTYHLILTKYLWNEVSYRIEQNTISQVSSALEIKEADLARQGLLSALSDQVVWSDVEDPVRPRQGARASLFLEAGGGPLGGDFPYAKAIGELRGYYPLLGPAFSRVVGAARLKVGWAEPSGKMERMPLFLRFYTGGTGSVRGFDRYQLGPVDPQGRPIGGTKLWETSAEVRFPLYQSWSGVVFYDGGWVWPEREGYNLKDVIYSAGGGVSYNTAIGPVSVEVGFPLTSNPRYPEYRIHLNIGYAF